MTGDVAELADGLAEPFARFIGEFGEGVDGELAGNFEPDERLDLRVLSFGHMRGMPPVAAVETTRAHRFEEAGGVIVTVAG